MLVGGLAMIMVGALLKIDGEGFFKRVSGK